MSFLTPQQLESSFLKGARFFKFRFDPLLWMVSRLENFPPQRQ